MKYYIKSRLVGLVWSVGVCLLLGAICAAAVWFCIHLLLGFNLPSYQIMVRWFAGSWFVLDMVVTVASIYRHEQIFKRNTARFGMTREAYLYDIYGLRLHKIAGWSEWTREQHLFRVTTSRLVGAVLGEVRR